MLDTAVLEERKQLARDAMMDNSEASVLGTLCRTIHPVGGHSTVETMSANRIGRMPTHRAPPILDTNQPATRRMASRRAQSVTQRPPSPMRTERSTCCSWSSTGGRGFGSSVMGHMMSEVTVVCSLTRRPTAAGEEPGCCP